MSAVTYRVKGARRKAKEVRGRWFLKKAGATNEEECGSVIKGRRGLSRTRPC